MTGPTSQQPLRCGGGDVGATLSYTALGCVRVHGDLDFRSAPLVRDALLEAISQPLGEDVQVDLAGVTFLDCAGLGALIAASNTARTRARRFVVTNPSGAARRILEICDLLDPLTRAGKPACLTDTRRAKQPRSRRGGERPAGRGTPPRQSLGGGSAHPRRWTPPPASNRVNRPAPAAVR